MYSFLGIYLDTGLSRNLSMTSSLVCRPWSRVQVISLGMMLDFTVMVVPMLGISNCCLKAMSFVVEVLVGGAVLVLVISVFY